MSNRPNHPSLDDIRTMPIGDIAALPADQLALLQDEAEVALQAAKAAVDWLTGAFTLRFAERAQSLRLEAGKDAGDPAAMSHLEWPHGQSAIQHVAA